MARSCIHCHQVGEALREYPRDNGQDVSDSILFPYPHPKSLGLIMDPLEQCTIKAVEPGSVGAKAGLQSGDVILEINGQQPISIADFQWVLHRSAKIVSRIASARRPK